MAREIRIIGPTGNTAYAHLFNSTTQRWNGTAFETFSVVNYSTYDISLTEDGSTGIYVADMPASVPAGVYDAVLFLQDGASPANGDLARNAASVDWRGSATAAASIPLGSLSGSEMLAYIVRSGWNRDDMDTELYDALTDTVLEMEQLFRFDEREKETTTTDTISVLGDYKISLESDFGHLVSVVLIDGDTTAPLNRVSKQIFDLLYSTPSSDIDTEYPKNFCIFAGSIYIGPPPDSTSYTYRLTYSQRLTSTINSTTSPVPFSAQYREILKDGTLRRLFKNVKNFDLAEQYRDSFGIGMERAMTRERRNRGGAGFVAYSDI